MDDHLVDYIGEKVDDLFKSLNNIEVLLRRLVYQLDKRTAEDKLRHFLAEYDLESDLICSNLTGMIAYAYFYYKIEKEICISYQHNYESPTDTIIIYSKSRDFIWTWEVPKDEPGDIKEFIKKSNPETASQNLYLLNVISESVQSRDLEGT